MVSEQHTVVALTQHASPSRLVMALFTTMLMDARQLVVHVLGDMAANGTPHPTRTIANTLLRNGIFSVLTSLAQSGNQSLVQCAQDVRQHLAGMGFRMDTIDNSMQIDLSVTTSDAFYASTDVCTRICNMLTSIDTAVTAVLVSVQPAAPPLPTQQRMYQPPPPPGAPPTSTINTPITAHPIFQPFDPRAIREPTQLQPSFQDIANGFLPVSGTAAAPGTTLHDGVAGAAALLRPRVQFGDATLPTPAHLQQHSEVDAAARAMLANPQAVPLQALSSASGTKCVLAFTVKTDIPISNQQRLVLDNGNISVAKDRLPTQHEWLATQMQILIEMNLLEHGVRIPISECTSSYLAIASAAVMGQYILFVTKMATAHSWATMAAFDKKHRESLAQAQGGSLDPNVLIHSFLLEECTNGGLYNGKRPKVNDDAPYRTATCRKFNTKNGCSHPNCRFIHKCSKCGKSHAVSDCTD